METIRPFLWFDGKAQEAVDFYVSIFPGSKILETVSGPEGSVVGLTFQLLDRTFMALNGGPHFTFTPAISMFVPCQTQDEIDTLWVKLTEGGTAQQCGWLTDRYGVSWQIVPTILGDLLKDQDRQRANRVFKAMMAMRKLDIALLQNAHGQDEAVFSQDGG
ncbi:VOC family protein [Hyphomicrobiales bacterium BP6-180914]|uniref:VOC family protein n=1 Tax=Lichenifustis flavocetrariae TaxID=2949735 RepID=A0AA41Z4C5_9HYPH|nr:VOC family protein [Lichenifustis flavocetrariae]MCW6510253.1 VOC family protein [Lichenifustis flavocetrariae]